MATPPFQVKALYEYTSAEEDDLKFPLGQIITVTDIEDDDWYFGEYSDATGQKQDGLFPKNFVNIVEPETPPRPSRRSQSKKDINSLPTSEHPQEAPPSNPPEVSSIPASLPPEPSEPSDSNAEQRADQQPPLSQKETVVEPPAVGTQAAASKPPAIPAASKPAPPAVAEKPTSGSFRDRINAFNKPAAPPVAPIKPSGLGVAGGSGFVKKPFVAPPPSKNAYVPIPREAAPQRIYKREEEPEFSEQPPQSGEADEGLAQPQQRTLPTDSQDEEQPKPTSLKDRIALLQKQQMEQAARRTDSESKKEKPKRPVKEQAETEDPLEQQGDDLAGQGLEKLNSADTERNNSLDLERGGPPSRPHAKPPQTQDAGKSPPVPPSTELFSDSNDADQSGVGDTEDGEELLAGQDDMDEKPQRKGTLPPTKSPQAPSHEADVGDEEDNAEEDEDQDVDPEVKRRLEIRERMAKMSGGMGMAGMFGPPMGLPAKSSTKQQTAPSGRKSSGTTASDPIESPASKAPPVPIIPLSSLQKVQSPTQHEGRTSYGDSPEEAKGVGQDQDLREAVDAEDIEEQPAVPTRRSTDRKVPPLPQGE